MPTVNPPQHPGVRQQSPMPSRRIKSRRRLPLWLKACLWVWRIPRKRWVYGLLAVIFVALVGKLFMLQMVAASEWRLKAQKSRNHSFVHRSRGRILDRNGVVLAQDNVLYDLYAHPRYYRYCNAQTLAQALGPVLNMPSGQLYDQLSDPATTITLAKNLSKDVKARIDGLSIMLPVVDDKTQKPVLDENGRPKFEKRALSGLDFVKKRVRNYPQGQLAAHVLGYVNDEADLAYGIEEIAKLQLEKAPGDNTAALLDGQGRPVRPEDIDPASVVNTPTNEDVTLTLDSRLQYVAEKALIDGVKHAKALRGSAIMLNPKTGEVLAYAVTPGYSPERYFQFPLSVFTNWTLSDVYPPGSTIKILTLAMALDNGVITPDTKIYDSGRMPLGGYMLTNYDFGKRGAPGNIGLVYLLMHSSNVGSAKVAMMLPPEKHRAHLKLLGFGSPTGIDLPSESGGLFKPLEEWDKPTQGSIGYGYSIASTPLQMTAAVASLANGGVWMTPHVLRHAEAPTGSAMGTNIPASPMQSAPGSPAMAKGVGAATVSNAVGTGIVNDQSSVGQLPSRRVFSPHTAQVMTDLLVKSIEGNKDSTVSIPGVAVAGKTGTSKKPKDGQAGYSNDVYTSFIGYYPAQSPKAIIMVVIDSPKLNESWGSTVAGPIFKQIAENSLHLLGIKRQTVQ
jgi:cell division protein FtsI (penicillin-binding protein 3)